MAKKKKDFRETTIQNYYDLKADKVDELVAALKDGDAPSGGDTNYSINANTGVYDPKNVTRSGKDKQFDPYKVDKLSRIPTWIKAIFVKWWFAGATSYFILWGLPLTGPDSVLLLGVVLGMVTDLFVNPVFRYMESDRREYDGYVMFPFPFKAFWTFFANIIYYTLVVYLVSVVYTNLNVLANIINKTADAIYIGVEPLLFGTICVLADMAFIGVKDGVVALVRRMKNRKKESVSNV